MKKLLSIVLTFFMAASSVPARVTSTQNTSDQPSSAQATLAQATLDQAALAQAASVLFSPALVASTPGASAPAILPHVSSADAVKQWDALVTGSCVQNRSIYSELNNFRSKMKLTSLKYEHFEKIELMDEGGQPTDLAQRYDPQYISARIQAIDALQSFADELNLLSGNDSPAKVASQINAIGAQIGAINQNLSSFGNSPKIDARKYVQPITHIAAMAAQLYLKYKQRKYLRQSISDARPSVDEICTLLSADTKHVFKNDYVTAVGDAKSTAISYWNKRGETMTDEEKFLVLAEIQDLIEKQSQLEAMAAVDSFQNCKDSFDKLADSVSRRKKMGRPSKLQKFNVFARMKEKK